MYTFSLISMECYYAALVLFSHLSVSWTRRDKNLWLRILEAKWKIGGNYSGAFQRGFQLIKSRETDSHSFHPGATDMALLFTSKQKAIRPSCTRVKLNFPTHRLEENLSFISPELTLLFFPLPFFHQFSTLIQSDTMCNFMWCGGMVSCAAPCSIPL